PFWQTAQHVEFRVAGRVVRPLTTPKPPTHFIHRGQRPNTVILYFEAILQRVERLRRHGQHRQYLRQHHAVLRGRSRGVLSPAFGALLLPFRPWTLCLSASKSDRIVRGGAAASAGCPASLASIKVFSSC